MSRPRGSTEEVLVRGLFEEHGAALVAYATRLLGDRAQGEDVVRETLIRAVREPGPLAAERGVVRAHLFAEARRLAGEPEETPTVLRALEALPRPERDVLYALYFQGEGVAETAAALGVPAREVQARSYRALHRLREATG